MTRRSLRILVVDDNRSAADALTKLLRRAGDDVEPCYDGQSAIDLLRATRFDVVLTDLKMEPVDGIAVLSAARSLTPPVDTIVFTAYGAVDVAVRAMHLGATDFLTKPVTVEQVHARLDALRGQATPAPSASPADFVARSPTAQALWKQVERAAGVPSPVWIAGELGAGRTFVARALHALGDPSAPFTVMQPRDLAEWPTHGTLVLPNVDVLDLEQQARVAARLAASPNTVRVVATASDDGRQQVAIGQLSPSLYYGLAVIVLQVPPLRQRQEDIAPLFERALDEFAVRYGRPVPALSGTALAGLRSHYWPGNIRELRNLAERTVVLGSDGFNLEVAAPSPTPIRRLEHGFNLAHHLEEVERAILIEALKQCDGDRAAVGKLLGVERNTLRYKLNKYDLLDR